MKTFLINKIFSWLKYAQETFCTRLHSHQELSVRVMNLFVKMRETTTICLSQIIFKSVINNKDCKT